MLTLEQTREKRAFVLTHRLTARNPFDKSKYAFPWYLPPLHPDEWAGLEARSQLPAWDGSVPDSFDLVSLGNCYLDEEEAGMLAQQIRAFGVRLESLRYGPEALTRPSAEWLRWSAECERRYVEASE